MRVRNGPCEVNIFILSQKEAFKLFVYSVARDHGSNFILDVHNGMCEELHVYQDFGERIVCYAEPELNSPIYGANRNVPPFEKD